MARKCGARADALTTPIFCHGKRPVLRTEIWRDLIIPRSPTMTSVTASCGWTKLKMGNAWAWCKTATPINTHSSCVENPPEKVLRIRFAACYDSGKRQQRLSKKQ